MYTAFVINRNTSVKKAQPLLINGRDCAAGGNLFRFVRPALVLLVHKLCLFDQQFALIRT